MTDTDKKVDLQQELGTLKKDVENLRVHAAEAASKIKDVGKEKVDSTVKSTVKSTKKAVKDAEKTLEKNPVATVAGAVGIGAILGSIARRLLSSGKNKKK